MPPITGKTGKKYWRSLNELADTPSFREFVEREFPAHASEWFGGSRRTFLKIMGASMALAGLASCRRWPAENLAPYAHRPAGRMDGVPVHYATAYEMAGMGFGVVAVSFDGRPIKVDGNPSHPLTRGASDTYLQASILNLYDPDRSRSVLQKTGDKSEESTWDKFASFATANIIDGGRGAVILMEASRSPSVAAMRKKLPNAQFFEYEPLSTDNQRAGAQAVYGRPFRAVPDLAKAQTIISIDADLFAGDPLSVKYNRDFAAGRQLRGDPKPGDTMNQLFVIESGFTLTGSMADHRRSVNPSQIPVALNALVAAVMGQAGPAIDKDLGDFIKALAKKINIDDAGNEHTAVVIAGHRQPIEVHAAVASLNALLRAPVDYYADAEDPRADAGWTTHADQIKAFAAAAKTATAVIILGANPVLTAPKDLDIESILKSAKISIHAGTHLDETATLCSWHLPLSHYLESWADTRTYDGTVAIAQPLIEPLFGGKNFAEILSLLAGTPMASQDIVKATAKSSYLTGFTEWAWKQALFTGTVAGSTQNPVTLPAPVNVAGRLPLVAAQVPANTFELSITPGAAYDGRYINNGWLMEMPDPMSRVCWDNPLLISPTTAKKLGLDSDDVVKLTANGVSIEATIYIMPGHADNALSLAAGYGRDEIGSIAAKVGSDPYKLRSSKDAAFSPVTLEKIGDKQHKLSCVQDHHVMDPVGKNRIEELVPDLVVEGTFDQYKARPALATKKILALSMFNEHNYDNTGDPNDPEQKEYRYKWGLAIDLTICTGCSACVIACQSENNVPIVGKEMVYRGREMHWLRLDRYFKHDAEAPQAVHQPVMCFHCENAPCEEVCPVAATTHSHEGLNMMTYNRCIGTRYCSNNCPYKVRRFNFFDYNAGTINNEYTPNLIRADINELAKMSKNPQVTIRSRGVMEKCTYCVQRIENARINLRAQNRGTLPTARLKDGDIVTACQQSCPTSAITFGDLNDKNSAVSKLHALAHHYGLLDADLNTKPRTQYLAKVRNPLADLDTDMYNKQKSEGFFFEEDEPAGTKKD